MNVAIIPARGGSKRIPGKNIRPFFGKPLIEYSIEAARRSGLFERIVVTTDAQEIADVATRAGAVVPRLRPAALADDHAPTVPVLVHALTELVPEGHAYEYACCILATAPFLDPKYLVTGHDMIRARRCSSVVSVTGFGYPILRALKLDDQGRLQWMWPEHAQTRSNDLEEAVHDAGQFYWLDVAAFLKSRKIVGGDAAPLHLPRHLVQDIDTPEDWQVAEQLYRAFVAREASS